MRRSVTISIWNDEGQILVVTNRRFGGFCLPGGKIEVGELPEEAAFRELKEETGLVPEGLKYLGCSLLHNPHTNDVEPYLCFHYIGYMEDKSRPYQNEEGTTPFWTDPISLLVHDKSTFSRHNKIIAQLGGIYKKREVYES